MDAEVLQVIKDLNLVGKTISGDSVENLPKIGSAEGRLPWTFSSIFHSACEGSFPHPVQFISAICYRWKEDRKRVGFNIPLHAICARGLRTLASFYREVDFKHTISNLLSERKIGEFELISNAQEDVFGHADLIIKFPVRDFRIWLFMLTPRGLKNTTYRLDGMRGRLVSGTHIICGQNIFDENHIHIENGWKLYSENMVNKCIDEMNRVLRGGSVMNYSAVKKSLVDSKAFLSEIRSFQVE